MAVLKRGIVTLKRRIEELDMVDVRRVVVQQSEEDDLVLRHIRDAVKDVFGPYSPESTEFNSAVMWAGPTVGGTDATRMHRVENGKRNLKVRLEALVNHLREQYDELVATSAAAPVDKLQELHPRIAAVANTLFMDGHHWQAVFEASKALVNYVKEQSGRRDLDGAALMRTVFSRNNPILAFNDLGDQTKQDEQEGMMHLFEGVVLGIRNQGGHSFPDGSEQRALEYLSLLSLLAYRVQETTQVK